MERSQHKVTRRHLLRLMFLGFGAVTATACVRPGPAPRDKIFVSPFNPDTWGFIDLKEQREPYELEAAQLERLQYPVIGLNGLYIHYPPGSLIGIASFFKPEVVRAGKTGEIMTQRGRVGLQRLSNPFKPDIDFAETAITSKATDQHKIDFTIKFTGILEARMGGPLSRWVDRIDVIDKPGAGERRAIVFGRTPTSNLLIRFNFQ